MDNERRYIVRGSQGGVDDSPNQPAGQSGAGQPGGSSSGQGEPDASTSGQTQAGGGSKDPGKRAPESQDLADQVWAKASNHYTPQIKKLEAEVADLRKRYATTEAKAKSAEQLASELESRNTVEARRTATIAEFAESRKKALPEHLRGIIDKAAGGDPYKALELLPDYEDLARRTQLKTIGGNAGSGGLPNIDYAAIQAAKERGDMQPLREAHKKHGEKDYNAGLMKWMAERGR